MSFQTVHAFSEKVALVTDILSPVGRAVALQLALQGSYVVGCTSPTTEVRSGVLDEMLSLGTLAHAVEAVVTTDHGVKKLVGAVVDAFGRLDLLVNCLKSVPKSSFEDSVEAEVDEALAFNFKASYLVTNACLPLMADRPKPRIVNVISRNASVNTPLFAATQAAVEGLTRSLATVLPAKFRVNAVAYSDAATVRSGFDPELFPMAGASSADDTARVVLYLLSPEAVGVNGQILEVAA